MVSQWRQIYLWLGLLVTALFILQPARTISASPVRLTVLNVAPASGKLPALIRVTGLPNTTYSVQFHRGCLTGPQPTWRSALGRTDHN